jgi:hypothetical protein
LTHGIGPRRGGSAGVTLAVMVLSVATLTTVIALLSVGGSNPSANLVSKTAIQPTQVASDHSAPASPADVNCVLPGPPATSQGGPKYLGPAPFTFVGGSSACATLAPYTPGVNSTANFSFTLNATQTTPMDLLISDNNNGTSSIPSGAMVTATVGSQTFTVQGGPGSSGPNVFNTEPVFTIPSGITTFNFTISVPGPYKSGTYQFQIFASAFTDTSRSYMNWSEAFPVNLVAQ